MDEKSKQNVGADMHMYWYLMVDESMPRIFVYNTLKI